MTAPAGRFRFTTCGPDPRLDCVAPALAGDTGPCHAFVMPTAEPSPPAALAIDRDRSPPRFLVVEDEAIARMAAVAALSEAGYRVIEADSGPAAMRALEDGDVRLLLTDIAMPKGIDGVQLAACAHRRWPRVAIVIVSGKVLPVPGDVPAGARFLAKPYAEAELLALVAEAVGE